MSLCFCRREPQPFAPHMQRNWLLKKRSLLTILVPLVPSVPPLLAPPVLLPHTRLAPFMLLIPPAILTSLTPMPPPMPSAPRLFTYTNALLYPMLPNLPLLMVTLVVLALIKLHGYHHHRNRQYQLPLLLILELSMRLVPLATHTLLGLLALPRYHCFLSKSSIGSRSSSSNSSFLRLSYLSNCSSSSNSSGRQRRYSSI